MATLLESPNDSMEHSSPDTQHDTTLSDPNNDQESSSDAFVIDSSLYLEEESLSAQSTPSRRPLRKLEAYSPDTTTLLSFDTTSSRPSRGSRKQRCNWVLWMVRIFVISTDVIVFLAFDADSGSVMQELSQPPPPQTFQPHNIPSRSKLSHARHVPMAEFRILSSMLDANNGESAVSSNVTWWVASGIFCLGICVEVWWKEVYSKRRRP